MEEKLDEILKFLQIYHRGIPFTPNDLFHEINTTTEGYRIQSFIRDSGHLLTYLDKLVKDNHIRPDPLERELRQYFLEPSAVLFIDEGGYTKSKKLSERKETEATSRYNVQTALDVLAILAAIAIGFFTCYPQMNKKNTEANHISNMSEQK